jgi:hypothetical protein
LGSWAGVYPWPVANEADITDIAATIAAMLNINRPSGCIGRPVYIQD